MQGGYPHGIGNRLGVWYRSPGGTPLPTRPNLILDLCHPAPTGTHSAPRRGVKNRSKIQVIREGHMDGAAKIQDLRDTGAPELLAIVHPFRPGVPPRTSFICPVEAPTGHPKAPKWPYIGQSGTIVRSKWIHIAQSSSKWVKHCPNWPQAAGWVPPLVLIGQIWPEKGPKAIF